MQRAQNVMSRRNLLLSSRRYSNDAIPIAHGNIQAPEYAKYVSGRLLNENSVAELKNALPSPIYTWLRKQIRILSPNNVYLMDGSGGEQQAIFKQLVALGMTKPLSKYDNCYLTRTDARDVARVEKKTFMVTRDKRDTLAPVSDDQQPMLGNWMNKIDHDQLVADRFANAMKGRTLYILPFSMGQPGAISSKYGIQLTDSPYVAASMRIMTHMGPHVPEMMKQHVSKSGGDEMAIVRCVHSVGQPLPYGRYPQFNWPCNPEKTFISHDVENLIINSFGSGYGGNSLLGKKCMALRLGSIMAQREGWLAEHMLIIGVTPPKGKKRYIAAAFPSQCGKTNLAMMLPALKGYKVECVGDDIAWMRFGDDGRLWAINPENGFFGVAPGTSRSTNPIAMDSIQRNTIFTNVAETSDGGFYWEGLEKETPSNVKIIDWQERPWNHTSSTPAAHPNSRFCTPAVNLSTLDEGFYSESGVPIDAIIFGGRRPHGVPLVHQALSWEHGVYYGTAMRSEATSAAEHKGGTIMHDPFAMRPFFGYNFGKYLDHWLQMPKQRQNAKMPKVFKVNWFRRDENNKFLWPGFGENIRVLDWILNRIDASSDEGAVKTAIGWVPKRESFNLSNLEKPVDFDHIFSVDKNFWLEEAKVVGDFLNQQVGSDTPREIIEQREQLIQRLHQ